MFHCEDCNELVSTSEYLKLARNPLFRQDGYFIIHRSCKALRDEVIEECGTLILIHSNYILTEEIDA